MQAGAMGVRIGVKIASAYGDDTHPPVRTPWPPAVAAALSCCACALTGQSVELLAAHWNRRSLRSKTLEGLNCRLAPWTTACWAYVDRVGGRSLGAMARKAGPKESKQYGYPCSSSKGPAGVEAAAARCHWLEAAIRSAAKPFPVAPVRNSLAGPFYPSLKGSHQIFWQEP